ncbi:hypothetical protein U1Q18_036821 [Sarracenia purpurea var. burkii]
MTALLGGRVRTAQLRVSSCSAKVWLHRTGSNGRRRGWFRRSEYSARLSSSVRLVGNARTEMLVWRV